MKNILVYAAMFLVTCVSQAKTVCNVNAGDPKQDMVFDRTLFTGEVTTPRYLLIKAEAQSAEEVQLTQFDSFEKWKAVNGATLVSLSVQENGEYGITVSHLDHSKRSNMLPLDAMAIGPVVDKQFLTLIVPAKNLSVVCVSTL